MSKVIYYSYTAVSRKVVLQKRKSDRDKVETELLWVTTVLHLIDWKLRYSGVGEGSSTNMCIHTFSFLLTNHHEPRPSSTKLLLPIIPIGILSCAFVLLWDNLCHNSCMCSPWVSHSSVVRASNRYLEGHGFDSRWGLRKFFFWVFWLEHASPLFTLYPSHQSIYHLFTFII